METSSLKDWKKEHDRVLQSGGLYVIGTDRHESRRIDNQLRGRSGRHGEPGESRFYISLQDDLMRIFGGGAVEKIMGRLGLDDNTPIEAGMVSKSIEQAQKRVEGYNFDVRKHLVEYDDVMDQQRKIVYSTRCKLLGLGKDSLDWILTRLKDHGLDEKIWKERLEQVGEQAWGMIVRQVALPVVDTLWMEHLTTMDDLREGVSLQAYGQKDPLVIYRQEGRVLFEKLLGEIWATVAERIERVNVEVKTKKDVIPVQGLQFKHQPSELGVADEAKSIAEGRKLKADSLPQNLIEGRGKGTTEKSKTVVKSAKVGRNDPCPCGSGKKYKKCHGK
jgi:preprotein translocase subunit SecA